MRVDRRLLAVCGLANLPTVVATAVILGRGWTPSGEFAQAELRLGGFWSDPPLLGAVGRLTADGVMTQHPGPLAWWFLYPVWALLGGGGRALSVATAVLAVAWVSVAVVLAHRRGGLAASVLVATVWLLTFRSVGARVVVEPWNPWFAVPAWLCLAVAVGAVGAGSRRGLAVVVLAASFVTQAHVGYAPWAIAAMVSAAVLFGRHTRATARTVDDPHAPRAGSSGSWSPRRAAALAIGVGAAAWALPLIQQVAGEAGNLGRIVTAYRQAAEPAAGADAAGRVASGMLRVGGPWMSPTITPPTELPAGLGTVAFVGMWAAAAVWGWHRGDRSMGALHLALASCVAVGTLTTARVLGPVFDYLVPWWSIIAAAIAGVSAWTVWRTTGTWRGAHRPAALRAGLGALVVALSVLVAVGASDPGTPGGRLSQVTESLAAQLGSLYRRGLTYRIGWEDPVSFGAVGYGLIDDADRRGVLVGGPDAFRPALSDRAVLPDEPDVDLVVVSGARIDDWRDRVEAESVAFADPRTPDERRDAAATRRRLRTELSAVGGAELADVLDDNLFMARSDPRVPPALRERIDRFAALGQPTAVFRLTPA